MRDSSAIPVRRVDETRESKPKVDNALPAITPAGPRKLVRPRLPDGVAARYVNRSASAPQQQSRLETSHAEAFYFQKQIQGQTLMVFVLEDGEQIEGQIEWYDRDAIKVKRGAMRTLIYKSSIKYLYKAAEGGTRLTAGEVSR